MTHVGKSRVAGEPAPGWWTTNEEVILGIDRETTERLSNRAAPRRKERPDRHRGGIDFHGLEVNRIE